MTDAEVRELENRRQNWEIHVEGPDGTPPTWSVFLRLDCRLMTERGAHLMAAHFAKALGLKEIVVHVR